MRIALAIIAGLLAHSLLVGEQDANSITLGLVLVVIAGGLVGLALERKFS